MKITTIHEAVCFITPNQDTLDQLYSSVNTIVREQASEWVEEMKAKCLRKNPDATIIHTRLTHALAPSKLNTCSRATTWVDQYLVSFMLQLDLQQEKDEGSTKDLPERK